MSKIEFFTNFSKKDTKKSNILAPLDSFLHLKFTTEEISTIKRLVCTQCSNKLLTFLFGLIKKCVFYDSFGGYTWFFENIQKSAHLLV